MVIIKLYSDNYRNHVEKLHEHLCDLVSNKLNNGHEIHDGKTTNGSTDYRSSKVNGNTTREFYWLNYVL